MKNLALSFLAYAALYMAFAVTLGSLNACSPAKSAAEVTLGAQLDACELKAATHSEAVACRNAVEAKWATDAGAEGGAP
jgi:hypothetical protein